jgi:hypothetical protein
MFAGTRWNDFVKDYASKNNVAYGCAITKAEVKEAYKLAYPKNKVGRPPKKDKVVKEKKPRGRPKKAKDNIQMKIVEKRPVKKGSTFLTEIPEIETSAENVVYEPLAPVAPVAPKPVAPVAPKPEDKKATKAVLSNPDLMGLIQSYLPNHTTVIKKPYSSQQNDRFYSLDEEIKLQIINDKLKFNKELIFLLAKSRGNPYSIISQDEPVYISKQPLYKNFHLVINGYSLKKFIGIIDDDLFDESEHERKNRRIDSDQIITGKESIGKTIDKDVYDWFKLMGCFGEIGDKTNTKIELIREPEAPSPAAPEASEFTKKMNELEAVLNEGSTPEILIRAKPLVKQVQQFYNDAGEDATPETKRAESLANIYNKGVRANKKTGGKMNRILFKRKGKKIGGSGNNKSVKFQIPLESEYAKKKMDKLEALLNKGSTPEILKRAKPLLIQIQQIYNDVGEDETPATKRAFKLSERYNEARIRANSGVIDSGENNLESELTKKMNEVEAILNEGSTREILRRAKPLIMQIQKLYEESSGILNDETERALKLAKKYNKGIIANRKTGSGRMNRIIFKRKGKKIGGSNDDDDIDDELSSIFENKATISEPAPIRPSVMNVPIVKPTIIRRPAPLPQFVSVIPPRVVEEPKRKAESPNEVVAKRGRGRPRKNGGSAISSVTDFAKKIFSNSSIPPALKRILDKYGNEKITGMSVGRTPVPSYITGALNVVSLGEWKKKFASKPFDKLYHLYMIIQTQKGQFIIEKNERINASENVPASNETMSISGIPDGLTPNILIERTEKYMGGKFLPYSAYDNNCQDFIIAVLKSNHLGNESVYKFVKQDTEDLFKASGTHTRKFANTLTDLGAAASKVFSGGYETDSSSDSDSDMVGGVSQNRLNEELNKINNRIARIQRLLTEQNDLIISGEADDEDTIQGHIIDLEQQLRQLYYNREEIIRELKRIYGNCEGAGFFEDRLREEADSAVGLTPEEKDELYDIAIDIAQRRDVGQSIQKMMKKAREILDRRRAGRSNTDSEDKLKEAKARMNARLDSRKRKYDFDPTMSSDSDEEVGKGRIGGAGLDDPMPLYLLAGGIGSVFGLLCLNRLTTAIQERLDQFRQVGVDDGDIENPVDEWAQNNRIPRAVAQAVDNTLAHAVAVNPNINAVERNTNNDIRRAEATVRTNPTVFEGVLPVARHIPTATARIHPEPEGRGKFGGRLNKENIVPPMRKPMPIREMDDDVIARMKARLIRKLGEVKLDLETALRMIELGDVSSEERFRTLQKLHGDIEEKLEEIDEEQEMRSAMSSLNMVARGRDDLKRELKNYNDILGHLSSHLLEKGKQDPKDSRDALKYAKELVRVLQKLKN